MNLYLIPHVLQNEILLWWITSANNNERELAAAVSLTALQPLASTSVYIDCRTENSYD